MHAKHLAQELAKRGHEGHMIHGIDAYRVKKGKTPPTRRADETHERDNHVHAVEAQLKTVGPFLTYASRKSSRIQRKFENLIRNVRPHVVHHHNTSSLRYAVPRKIS